MMDPSPTGPKMEACGATARSVTVVPREDALGEVEDPFRYGSRWVKVETSEGLRFQEEQGYYTCNPRGDRYVGWHVNRGVDQAADYYPISHFRRQYYRPGVVAKVLELHDQEMALREAARLAPDEPPEAPPSLAVIEPRTDGLTVTKPVLEVKVLAVSQAVAITCRPPRDRPAVRSGPKLAVLAVGISDYVEESLRRCYASGDAEAALFASQEGKAYSAGATRVLGLSVPAPLRDILAGLGWADGSVPIVVAGVGEVKGARRRTCRYVEQHRPRPRAHRLRPSPLDRPVESPLVGRPYSAEFQHWRWLPDSVRTDGFCLGMVHLSLLLSHR